MAKFLEKLDKVKDKVKGKLNKEPELTAEEEENIRMMEAVHASMFSADGKESAAQPPQGEAADFEDDDASDIPPQYAGLTREQAKAELERRISEKLSSMSLRDLDELLAIEEKKERERAAVETRMEERRKKRRGSRKTDGPDGDAEDTVLADIKRSAEKELENISREELVKEPARKPEPEQKRAQGPKEVPPSESLDFTPNFTMFDEKPDTEEDEAIEKQVEDLLREYDGFTDRIYDFFGSSVRSVQNFFRSRIEKVYEKYPEKRELRAKKNKRAQVKAHILRRNFARRERETAARMVHLINRMDKHNEELADKTTVLVAGGTEKFNLAREWADLNKKKLLTHFAVAVLIALGAVAVFNYMTAYEYAYNGRVLGMVKNQEDVLKIVDLVSEQLSKEHGAEISIDRDQDITFNRIFALHKDIDSMEDVLGRLTYMQDMNARGYGIYVDGKRIAIVDSEETADAVLEHVQNTYLSGGEQTNYESVGFAETVEVKPLDTKLGRLQNPDAVYSKILTGAVAQKVHLVQAGETFSGISKMYGLTMDELRLTNPDVTPERLSIGQEIILSQAVPMLTVQTVEVTTLEEAIPHETIYENSESMYIGEQSTKVKGVDGLKLVTARIVKNNGLEVGKLELESEILSEPTSAVVRVGIKEPPPRQGTGSFIYPVSGYRLTSKFGSRWGRMHYGIDLACKTGTKIVASDGGTVIYSGYSGSYGYVVKIDHGGNMVTVYAHCSKLLVKKGEKVYQGQHIANVGSTGRSTGPHCHFEVQVNGVQKNPLNYL